MRTCVCDFVCVCMYALVGSVAAVFSRRKCAMRATQVMYILIQVYMYENVRVHV